MDTILQRRLQGWTTRGVRERGSAYQRAGKVRLTLLGDGCAVAQVQGSDRYDVTVAWAGELDFECTCPYAQDGSLCKHVWATAIELDQRLDPSELHADDDELDPSGEVAPAELIYHSILSSEQLAQLRQAASPERRRTLWSEYQRAQRESSRWRRLLPDDTHPAAALLGASTEQTWYLIDLRAGVRRDYYSNEALIMLHCVRRTVRRNGALGKPTAVVRPPAGVQPQGVEGVVYSLARTGDRGDAPLGGQLALDALEELCEKGRLGAVAGLHAEDVVALRWDATELFHVVLQSKLAADGETHLISAVLRRNGSDPPEELSLEQLTASLALDLLVTGDRLIRVHPGHAAWVDELIEDPLRLSKEAHVELAAALSEAPGAPEIEGHGTPHAQRVQVPPQALLRLKLPEKSAKLVRGTLTFCYGEREAGYRAKHLRTEGALLRRDLAAETSVVTQLHEMGVRVEVGAAVPSLEALGQPDSSQPADKKAASAGKPTATVASALAGPTAPSELQRPFAVKFDVRDFSSVAPALLEAGFVVQVEGKPYRRAGTFSPIIESGQDWFELEAAVDYEGELVHLPELLRAVRNKEQWVRLRDGGLGLLPTEWLDSLSQLAQLIPPRAKSARFHPLQAQLVEGVLAGAAEPQTDEGFTKMKRTFAEFATIKAKNKPRGFQGQLRNYQRFALGWLTALDELGFGGCLADDMGLGKTVVVLAWLQHRRNTQHTAQRRTERSKARPSLLVVPTSLLFNWQRECERFTPKLKLLLHHGVGRLAPGKHMSEYDVVLTSYGTLRRDAAGLSKIPFDYVVLDEAHSIKNEWTGAHKAARGLSSRRRLALTGTPVENHLGELWSLLTYLNPDVMQSMRHLQKVFEGRRLEKTSLEAGVLRSIQPFILRRTKSEVAKDLPERVEKTLQVTLSKRERELYDELADYYRKRLLESRSIAKNLRSLGSGSGNKGAGRQMAEALEGLLRLRQAACHPGLIDETHASKKSSKFEVLLEQLQALRSEGHKALVFSQFTKLLQLLKPHLKEAGLRFAYLDGTTKDREAEVERFTKDPKIDVFLISLKAGGVGLNLVAADYVFLLDPWWNPASEAQAIDRAHRIGQKRTVIAYRLLSEGTVEGKVAALQDEKRQLALSLFGDAANFSAKFTREDLEQLLA